MKKFWKKLPKWQKVVLCVVGALVVLMLVVCLALKIWLSTWKTYTNDEFGFSFRYPSNWFISGDEITLKHLNSYGEVTVYIDSKKKVPIIGQDINRSPGDVQMVIEKTDSLLKAHEALNQFSNLKPVKYGKYIGNTLGGIGGGCDQLRLSTGCFLTSLSIGKSFDLKANYYYYVNSLSATNNMNLLSRLKTYYFGWIGSSIVDSFNFYK